MSAKPKRERIPRPSTALDHRTFKPIGTERSHELVADQVRRQIKLGLIQPNETLPPERELASLLAVGRATVQAAIDLLEAEGMVTRRRGRYGGTFVLGSGEDDELLAGIVPKLRRETP